MPTPISGNRPKQDWGTDEATIAAEARTQTKPRESRATEQNQCLSPGAAELASRHKPSASARAAAAHMAASGRKDCAVEGATVVGTCSAGLVAAGAGVATGPGEIFIVGAAGFACGLAYINYADCLKENKP